MSRLYQYFNNEASLTVIKDNVEYLRLDFHIMKFKGVVSPMITPAKNGKVDYNAFRQLIDFLKEENIEGFFPASSTGAFPFLTVEEHREILRLTRDDVPAGKYILAGISRNNQADTLSMGKFAADIGMEGIVVVTPYYLKFSQEDLFSYFSKIAESIDLPIIVYNIPQLTGNEVRSETLSRLMENHSNIVGVKDSSGDMMKFNKYFIDLPKYASIFQGQDDLLLASMSVGASGGVCGSSNFSGLIHEVYLKRKLDAHMKVVKIMELIRKFKFPVSVNYLFSKLILNKVPAGYTLFPLNDLSRQEEELLKSAISKII